MVKRVTTACCCAGLSVRVLKKASRSDFRRTGISHWPSKRIVRSNWDSVGGLVKTWPVCRKPNRFSPALTGTAVSVRPAAHEMVEGWDRAIRDKRWAVRKQAAHDRLLEAITAQKAFSPRFP